MTNLITLIILVIFGSALFSGLEAALFAVSPSKVGVLKEQGRKGSSSLYKIKQKMSRPIIIIVIFNNIINIVGSIFVGLVATDILGSSWIGVVSAVLTFLIIIFGEIIPKTIGENNAERISLFFAPVLLFLTKALFPIVWTLEKLTSGLIKNKNIVSEEEIQMMSHLGTLEGSIEEDEREIIKNVFTLNDRTANDIMTPRTIMKSFEINSVIGDVEEDIYSLVNSRLPVYEGDLDNIKGIVHRKSLLIALAKDEKDKTVGDLMRSELSVPEGIKCDDLIRLFQRKREHLAIVKDEFGGTSGLVTLEDVLEELVGEIIDEEDEIVDFQEEARKKNEEGLMSR